MEKPQKISDDFRWLTHKTDQSKLHRPSLNFYSSTNFWTTKKSSFNDTKKQKKKNQILSRKMKKEKKKQNVRMRGTSFLKIREEKSSCLSITQVTAATMASSGLSSMNNRQKNAFGQQSQRSER